VAVGSGRRRIDPGRRSRGIGCDRRRRHGRRSHVARDRRRTLEVSEMLANQAAGIVVGKFGPATLTAGELAATF
jgi:hypothetical protein